MKWILFGVVAIIACFLFCFIVVYVKHWHKISSRGGTRTICNTLINGLLKYSSARIIQDRTIWVTVGGTFTDIVNRDCGYWSVIIQPQFNILNVKYQAYIDLDGGMVDKKVWNFPINMNQEDMLAIIKKEANQWTIFAVYK